MSKFTKQFEDAKDGALYGKFKGKQTFLDITIQELLQMQSEIKSLKQIIGSLNMLGADFINHMGVKPSRGYVQNGHKAFNQATVMMNGTQYYGLEIVEEYIVNVAKINAVSTELPPIDYGNKCYKYVDGKYELDHDKAAQGMM